jgi:hypothetical protein
MRFDMRSLSVLGIGCVAIVALGAGCSSSDTSTEAPVATTQSALFSGTPSASHNEVTRLLGAVDFVTDRFSATLLAPTLAVTTLQAVAKTQAFGSGGDQEGAGGTVCGAVGTFYDVSNITLLLFNADGSTTTLGVNQIIANGQTDTCQGDLAFLVLSQPVQGVNFPQLVFDKVPAVNDPITACGTGITDTACALSPSPLCNSGKVILPNGGSFAPAQTTYPAGLVVVSNNVCGDDPGSPLYDSNNAMIGLLAANFETDSTVHPVFPNLCYCDATEVGIGTLISSQQDFIARAFAVVGSSPWREGHPKPAEIGGTCVDSLDCTTQLCVNVGTTGYCSADCETAPCPASTVCTAVGTRSVCLPDVTPHPASCAVGEGRIGASSSSSSPFSSTWPLSVGFLTVGVFAGTIRRRRRSTRGRKS